MKKSLSFWQFVGFVFTGITGVLLHFLVDWTNQNIIVASFSAINESIWEHLKLLFFPMFVFALIENRYIGKEYNNFWCVKLIGIVVGIVSIPVIYYTINGIFGPTPDWVNIAIFFVAVFISYFVVTKFYQNGSIGCESPLLALLILFLIAVLFVVLTFIPPHIPIFKDPITDTYGYWQVI